MTYSNIKQQLNQGMHTIQQQQELPNTILSSNIMNKTTLSKGQPYIRSLDTKKFSKKKLCGAISCSTQLPPISKETPIATEPTSIDSKREFPICQFVPRRLQQSQSIIDKVLSSKIKKDREPREGTLIDIKKELIKIIDQKRKEACYFRNSEIRARWDAEREAKKVRDDEERREHEEDLRFKEEERQRYMLVMKRRRADENKFLQVGKRRMRDGKAALSYSSEEFLKCEIEGLKSRLREECINVLRQKDSFHSSMGRQSTLNPENV